MTKALLGFSGTDSEFLAEALGCYSALATIELVKSAPPGVPTLEEIKEAIDNFQRAFEESKYHDSRQVALRNKWRAESKKRLGKVALFLEAVSDDDLTHLKEAFRLKKTRSRKGKSKVSEKE
ncbi:hypothetical protein LPW11_08740 [Geomonas sp. RF6]|uniref:hypothetical protein n=1 Tax=Geomonas sp. RF6 TaxID=2897342 RepID=UPI001E58F1D5|nr:hypothetical protein [Geomonas sp. RF6]UFS72265.1 hypothetical protein LPW11_08740 [Geomonas sp. RF6]